jgi:hypothetical protein
MIEAERRLQDLERRMALLETTERGLMARARIYNTGNQTLTTGIVTQLTWTSNRYDVGGLSNANGFTIVTAGWYHVGASVRWETNPNGQRFLFLYLDGATIIRINSQSPVTAGYATDMGIETEYYFAAGATVRLHAFQDSGGNLDILAAGNYSPEFWISAL